MDQPNASSSNSNI